MIQTVIAFATFALAQQAPLTPQPPVIVPGGPGHFDFMNVDAENRFVLACHPQKSSFTVVNLATGDVREVDAGVAVNGIAADPKGKKVYAAGPGKTLVEFDETTWSKVASLPLDGPGDTVQFDAKNGVVYVDNDDGTNLWFVDPATLKITATVTIKEAPEVMIYDATRNKIFQNIKSANAIQVVDAASHQVVADWTLGDLTSPHGLAVDEASGKVFSVGKNGKLVILDADSGKILQTVDVVKGSDQIAYDADLKRLYIPGGGVLQVVQISDAGASVVGSTPVAPGCHSVTVDPQTHDVWVCYADAANSYVQKFAAGS